MARGTQATRLGEANPTLYGVPRGHSVRRAISVCDSAARLALFRASPSGFAHRVLLALELRPQVAQPGVDFGQRVEVAIARLAGEFQLLDRRGEGAELRVHLADRLVMQRAPVQPLVGAAEQRVVGRLSAGDRLLVAQVV